MMPVPHNGPTSSEGYRYAKLGSSSSFRLLHIVEADDGSPLTFLLEDFEIGNCPNYVALSYCWGPNRYVESCAVNDQNITITTSLASALQQIRRDNRKDERYIWVDAICINQADIEEKDTQIKHMPQIYARARKVLAWLSRGDSERRALQNVLRFIDAGLELPGDEKEAYYSYLALMRAFVLLSQVDYFGRIWICQEVCLARDIELMALSARVSWVPFFQALSSHAGTPNGKHWKIQSKLHEYVTTHTMHLIELNSLRGRILRHEPMPLLQALYLTRRCEATYVKDKIFGLLGLVTDSWLPLQSLYYGDDLEDIQQKITLAEMVDMEPAAAILGSPHRLDIITFTSLEYNIHEPGSPRWSPSWVDQDLWKRLRRWQLLRLDWVPLQLHATNCVTQIPTRADNGALLAHGRSLGAILHPTHNPVEFPYENPAVFCAAAKGVLDELSAHGRKGTMNWKPRLRDGTREQMQPWKADLERYRRRLSQLVDHLTTVMAQQQQDTSKAADVDLVDPITASLYSEFQTQIREALLLGSSLSYSSSIWTFQRMLFFRTSKGFLGFGLLHGSPGDIVYLVEGLSVPVILRRYGTGLSSHGFVVVGEIFTLGVMQGEYFADDQEARPLLKLNHRPTEREEIHIL